MDTMAVENDFTKILHNHPQLSHKQVQFMSLLKQFISEYVGLKRKYYMKHLSLVHHMKELMVYLV